MVIAAPPGRRQPILHRANGRRERWRRRRGGRNGSWLTPRPVRSAISPGMRANSPGGTSTPRSSTASSRRGSSSSAARWTRADLDAAGLRATLGPSAMTLGGMLKHLARFEDDMSSEWLHGRGQLPPWNAVDWSADPAWDWRSAADDSPEQLYALWREAVGHRRSQQR